VQSQLAAVTCTLRVSSCSTPPLPLLRLLAFRAATRHLTTPYCLLDTPSLPTLLDSRSKPFSLLSLKRLSVFSCPRLLLLLDGAA
jgi:hypothetical protein